MLLTYSEVLTKNIQNFRNADKIVNASAPDTIVFNFDMRVATPLSKNGKPTNFRF